VYCGSAADQFVACLDSELRARTRSLEYVAAISRRRFNNIVVTFLNMAVSPDVVPRDFIGVLQRIIHWSLVSFLSTVHSDMSNG
jgi:hypothetical protein